MLQTNCFTYISISYVLFQVHVFYQPCGGDVSTEGRVSCNCAVAIQSGDDVFVIGKTGESCVKELQFSSKYVILNIVNIKLLLIYVFTLTNNI